MKKLTFKSLLLLCALIVGNGSLWADGILVSGLSDISSGKTYYIAALNSSKYYTVPKTTISGQTFTCTEGTYNSTSQTLTTPNGAGEFVFTAVDGKTNAYYIYNTNLEKYLVATGSKTFGYVTSSNSDYGYWTFSTVAGGGFSGQFSKTHNSKTHYMRAYSNQVKCYDGASNNGIYLFEKFTPCATPTFSPVAGEVTKNTVVTISSTTTGSTIYYTTDNSTPTTSSAHGTAGEASAEVTISSDMNVKAIAVKDGKIDSEVATAAYTITSAVATTTAIDASGITNTDVYVSTSAGSFAATVKDNEEATITAAAVTWSSSNTDVATINENTGALTLVAAGSTTITASYAGVTNTYLSSSDTYELTVTSSAPYVQPTSVTFNMNYEWLGSSNGDNISQDKLPVEKEQDNVIVTITDGTSTRPRGDGNYIRVYKGSTITFAAPTGYCITSLEFTTGGNGSWTAPTVSNGFLSDTEWTGKAPSVTFYLSGSCFIASVDVALEEATAINMDITSNKWASFSSAYEVEIPTGVTAYYAQKKDAENVTLKEITGGYIPANTGVVVYSATANTYTANITTTGATLGVDNILYPWLTAGTPTAGTYYTLAVDGEKNPIFKKSSGGILAAGKAYLVMPGGSSAPSEIRIVDEENNATNIESVEAVEEGVKFIQNGQLFIKKNGVVYDVLGTAVR